MTMFKPNLRVSELQVNVSGKIAFKERFHSGLNIIRGQNSSGKSTIMDFLYYGLVLLRHEVCARDSRRMCCDRLSVHSEGWAAWKAAWQVRSTLMWKR